MKILNFILIIGLFSSTISQASENNNNTNQPIEALGISIAVLGVSLVIATVGIAALKKILTMQKISIIKTILQSKDFIKALNKFDITNPIGSVDTLFDGLIKSVIKSNLNPATKNSIYRAALKYKEDIMSSIRDKLQFKAVSEFTADITNTQKIASLKAFADLDEQLISKENISAYLSNEAVPSDSRNIIASELSTYFKRLQVDAKNAKFIADKIESFISLIRNPNLVDPANDPELYKQILDLNLDPALFSNTIANLHKVITDSFSFGEINRFATIMGTEKNSPSTRAFETSNEYLLRKMIFDYIKKSQNAANIFKIISTDDLETVKSLTSELQTNFENYIKQPEIENLIRNNRAKSYLISAIGEINHNITNDEINNLAEKITLSPEAANTIIRNIENVHQYSKKSPNIYINNPEQYYNDILSGLDSEDLISINRQISITTGKQFELREPMINKPVIYRVIYEPKNPFRDVYTPTKEEQQLLDLEMKRIANDPRF